jgi:hypothetical protein
VKITERLSHQNETIEAEKLFHYRDSRFHLTPHLLTPGKIKTEAGQSRLFSWVLVVGFSLCSPALSPVSSLIFTVPLLKGGD